MTREIKLALILGSALVLVVGVLISDHMSGASRASLERIASDSNFNDGRPASAQEIIIKPAPPTAQQAFDAPTNQTGTTPTLALNEPRPDAVPSDTPAGADTTLLAMGDDPASTPSTQLEDAPIDSVAAFRDWAERQGVRLIDMANSAPPALEREQTSVRRPESATPQQVAQQRSEPSREHVVVKGDSLWKLAERYYGDGNLHTALQKFNESRLGARGDLLLDTRILIPSREALTGKPASPANNATRDTQRPVTTPTKAAPARTKTYTVQRGDTLGVIAQKTLGTSKRWRDIYDANKSVVKDPDVLLVGSTLKIPSS